MKNTVTPCLGTVYLIEQGISKETQYRDLNNIKDAGLKLVVLWPPVSRWDAGDGVSMAFDTVDRVMDYCHELSLKAILELEGQNPTFQFMPDCLFEEDFFSTDDTGKHWISYLHPEADRIICDYMRAVAVHFKDHPALIGYDVFNEVNFRSTDKHTVKAFQQWLEVKYDDIKALNYVWGRFYTDFSQIRVDNFNYAYSRWSSMRPELDFQDFFADTIQILVKRWGDTIREVDPDHPIIADNSWSMTCFDNMLLGNDDWKVAEVVDTFGLSVYPQSWDIHIASDPASISQIYRGGVSCCAPGKPVMVSELQTHNQTVLAQNSSVFDEIGLWTWQAFMHGISSLVYWKWKPFTRGFQVSGRGMTLQDGTPNNRCRQAEQIAGIVNVNPGIFRDRTVVDNGVAMLYNPECDRFTDLTLPDEKSGFYRDAFAGWYRFLFNKGITPLIIKADDLDKEHTSHLKLIIAPSCVMLPQKDIERLCIFIEKGGKVIADGRFAVVDENCFAYETAPGGRLKEVFGYRELDFLSPYKDTASAIANRFSVIRLEGAECSQNTLAGDPLNAITASTLYIPTFFGYGTDDPTLAPVVSHFLERTVDKSCQVLEKSAETDVIVSRGKAGMLVSACNYAESRIKVRVMVNTAAPCRALTEDSAAFKTFVKGNFTELELSVEGRDIAAVIFEN
ncbi:beta-galactosidase [Gemmatimonadota bacterium]